ncbi:TetR/AcrR family transcriptional regulator [Brevibacillus sp. SYSU BS000544]|uniref:TetR/AcrR family transcriptional regulator n=1 Tax=Brevibacillus sp. SYSU BS000544 TaxID=3416443 RepID=UPI003CE459EB
MEQKLSLRERKKYLTMSSILKEFILSLEEQNFHEILLEDVCNKANVSKVTFFRYFHSKEEVLDYFVLRWCFQRSLEINSNAYTGLEGIQKVFQSAAEIPNAEKILVSLLYYYSKLKEKPTQKQLSEYERYVIANGSTDGLHIQIYSLREIILYYLRQITELDVSKRLIVTEHLLALFYGIPFQVHIQMLGARSLSEAYKDHLEILFNGF